MTLPAPAPATTATPAPALAASPSWAAPWVVVPAFRAATTIFDATMDLCASGPEGTRCLGATELGPLASVAIASPAPVWGFSYVCGVGAGGAFLCNRPSADRPQQGPPRLESVASVAVHAAAHRDGTLSVTSNRAFQGWTAPAWAKVVAVTDAIQVASSWYATRSCYVRRTGEVACVEHAADATPQPVPGVTDAARIWKTDQALWVLTKRGDLLATRQLQQPVTQVASGVVDFAPDAAAPGREPGDPRKGSENPEVPCAVQQDGRLLCGLARDWTLSPVQGAGPTRRVFGGSDWICAVDDGGTTRCVRAKALRAP